MNGRNVLAFDGVDDYLYLANFPGTTWTAITIINVFKNDGTHTFGPAGFSISWEGHPVYRLADQLVLVTSAPTGWVNLNTKTSPTVHTLRVNQVAAFNIDAQERFDGTVATTQTGLPYAWGVESGKWLTIGMRSDAGVLFGGDWAETYIFSSWISDTNVGLCEAALKAKWGTP